MKPRVFVVQPIPEVALNIMREVAEVTVYPYMDRQIETDVLIANAKRSDYLFVMHETTVPAEVINANPDLKGIGAMGGLTALIDFDAARARKLPIVAADRSKVRGGGTYKATADLTMAMILDLAYRVLEADRYTRAGGFKQEQNMALMGIGCMERTIGLIGLGQVGEHVAKRARAFDMDIIYTKRTRFPEEREREMGLEWAADKDDVLRRSDFVCILCDYNPSTHNLIGARELALMKPTAYLINTARAWIVEQEALIKALQDGTIAGAGLDVYWDEPPATHDPHAPEVLYRMDNVVLTPHNGGGIWINRNSTTGSIAEGIVALIKGERPDVLINPEIYD
jgi:glyoxylate reductase